MIRVKQDQSAWKLRIILLILALIPLYAVQVIAPNVAQAVTAPSNCNTNPSANSLRVSPAHGQVLYIDSGSSTKVDASYVGYRVNYSGSGSKTVWVQLSNFTGGKVTLANPLDAAQSLVSIASSDTKTAYFLLKATGATLSAQSHLVTIFDRRPDLNGATTLLTCSFTFLQVQETIKASANKINTVTGTLSPTAATLGGTLTVAVTSAGVGKVGGGKSPDFSLFWISPAAVSSWPTQSLRLESVSITFNCTSGSTIGNSSFTVTNTLSLSNAAAYCYSNNSQTNSWTSSYVFRIIGPGPSSLTPSPIAMIASGTQYKHSDINALSFSSAINLSTVSTAAFTIKVRAVAETQTASLSYVRYTITESTTANTLVNVDELIDKIAAGVTYQSGSTKLTNSVSTNTVIPDPTTIASDPSPPPLHFIGPFSVISGTNTVVSYLVALPCSASAASYQNVVTAKIGSQTLGITGTLSSASTVSVSTVSSGGNCSSTVTNDQTINLSPTAQTQPATALSASGTSASATLNGYGTGYGLSGVTAQFRYSTDPNLINGATLTTSQAITGSGPNALTANLTGLSVNTIYYFRAEVTSSAGTITGVTLSFLTPDVLSAPTVITNAVTNLSGTSVTLNGYINPHLNTVTPITFEYCLYAAGTCDATHIPASPTVLNVATDSVATNGTVSSIDLSLSGSGDYYFNSDDISGASRVTSLTAGGTYFYQARATCANTVTTVCTSTSVSFTGGIKQFTVGAPIVVTSPATVIGPNSAIINGTFSANGSPTPQYYFNYCQAGVSTCSATSVSGSGVDSTTARSQSGNLVAVSETVTALQGVTLTPNTLYYFQILGVTGGSVKAYGDILPFTTLGIVTTSLPSGPVNSPYSASIVGGGGSGSYTFSTASTLAAGLTLSSEGVLSGTPTVAGDYSITVTVTDQVHGTTYSKNFTYSIVGVTTTAATSIAQVTATINGTSANNLSNPQFCFSSSNPGSTFTYGSGTCAAPINASGSYLANVTGLSSNTSYYFQLFGVVNGTRYSGAVLTFVTLPPYTITVNAGTGGTAGSSASSFLSGGSANLTATPSLGYNFTSWSCSGATVTTTTSNPATLSSPTGNVICTANFSPISYNITYNLQGGNISGSTTNPQSSVPYNSNALSAPHKPNNPTQTGYSFIGWNTSAKMGSKIDTFTVSGAATLYAQWSPDTLTVTFHINNGSGTETSTQSFYFDVAGSLNAKPSGWTNSSAANFLGWNTSS
ncbi:MAG: hypothetical protein EBV30_02095, partial [Actinobacteria bacterium]|nr:hypothetical protein [Actinomycetota bacterium]